MNLTVEIPDELATQLSAAGGDLSRRFWKASPWENTGPSAYRRRSYGGC
jgi:hypothetical protein